MKRIILFILLSFLPMMAFANYRVLVGSPVRQISPILQEFLASLSGLEHTSYTADFFFVDDSDDRRSSDLLRAFAKKYPCQIVAADKQKEPYFDHAWTDSLLSRVAGFKDQILQYAKEKGYDYVLLIDSDVILHPKTVDQLIAAKKDIVSNILWTQRSPHAELLPQVWMHDANPLMEKPLPRKGVLSREGVPPQGALAFLCQLQEPGTHEVGGLGACTLICKAALQKPLSFQKIKNLSFEDRDAPFCVRAAIAGMSLYADTHFPAYHLYRLSDLAGVANFKARGQRSKDRPRITLSMTVKNGADLFLREALEQVKPWIADAVIIDNGSSDGSAALCKEVLADIPCRVVQNCRPQPTDIDLRKQQWNETIQNNPDWILFLDASEVLAGDFKDMLRQMQTSAFDVIYFRVFDFWDADHYRDDLHWHNHQGYTPLLMRYRTDISYFWPEQHPHQCTRFPTNAYQMLGLLSEFKIKNFAFADPERRAELRENLEFVLSNARPETLQKVRSLADSYPNLAEWRD